MASFYKHYTGKTVGRILHFIYHYCGYDASERAEVADNRVIIFNRPIATFKWLNGKRETWTASSPKKQLKIVLDRLTTDPTNYDAIQEAQELSEFMQEDWSQADIPEFDFVLPELNEAQKVKKQAAIMETTEDDLPGLGVVLGANRG